MNSFLALTTLLAGVAASAEPLPVPRADDIETSAANCNIGPFGQTSKAGIYNPYCIQLTDAEKCLALVKRYLGNEDGVLHPVRGDRDDEARAGYCLDEFRRGLLGK